MDFSSGSLTGLVKKNVEETTRRSLAGRFCRLVAIAQIAVRDSGFTVFDPSTWQATQASMDFPLKTDFFPQMRLSADERRRYVATGAQSAKALRSSMKTLDWKKTMEKDGVTYAQAHCIEGSGVVPNSPSSSGKTDDESVTIASACLMMSATAFAAGTINETLEALASPVTEDYRRAMHFLHGSRFLDGVCLHTIAGVTLSGGSGRGSNSQAFTTVKWAAFDDGKGFNATGSPVGTDYCFLEHSGIHRGDSNSSDPEHFGFSIQESIVRECEVPSLTGVGLARGHFHRTGILILPTDRPDVVQITSILQMRMSEGNVLGGGVTDSNLTSSSAGKTTSVTLARRMHRRVGAVGRLDLLLERRRLNKLRHVPRGDWVADDARKACAVCVKPFALRRRKHHCRHCGEVVCASCAPTREVDEDTTTIRIRICTACVVQSRTGSQTQDGYDIFMFHVPSTGTSPSTQSSTNSTGECTTPTDKNVVHEVETRPKSLSSGSSTFSISSDSQISSRLTRAGYTGGAIRLYDYEDASSGSSSSYSLSEFDSFDNLVSIPLSNQNEVEGHTAQRRRNSQRRSSGPSGMSISMGSNSSNSASTGDLLERIQGMKADLSSLTTSYQQFSDTSSRTNSFFEDEFASTPTSRSGARIEAPEVVIQDARRRRTRMSDLEDDMDIDFINDDEHFTLLCPETLSRQWRTRTSSRVRQDAGEKSQLRVSISNMSFVSTLSNSTMLWDDGEDPEQRNSQDNGANERYESQAELLALRQQVEGLHRSLAAATSQLDTIRSSRQQTPPPLDLVSARHQATYRLLVEELHEIMGLPRPGCEH